MSEALYYLIIYPIELIIEVVFYTVNNFSGNPGIAIVVVSLIVNFLAFPLYRRADAIQEAERNKQEAMSKWVSHIKKNFKGDKRVMMLSAYYREQHYQPYYTLRSSVSLLLQIPFFIAAYHFLSNLKILNDASFLFITNLGEPDQLIKVGAIAINLLPVLMTLINFCSSAIYTKDISWKNKWQLYAIALIFLVLLYDRPSGLVLYWTLNNLFSLCKNIFMKLLHLPKPDKEGKAEDTVDLPPVRVFVMGGLVLTLLMGVLIPSAIIASSPTEFIEADVNINPLIYVFNTFLTAAGMFCLWFSIFYALAASKIRYAFSVIMFIFCGAFLTDYLFFGRNLGNISSFLIFDNEPTYSRLSILINAAVLFAVIVVIFLIWKKKRSLLPWIYAVASLSLIIMSAVNIVKTANVLKDTGYIVSDKIDVTKDKILPLSRSGKNVVIIMIDRASGIYMPYIFAEKPELKETYSGFKCYRNVISFGKYTNFGTPPLFGGYEYTPDEIDKRSDETLASKQNESDLVLPVIFSENGFTTTVCDPEYVNYHYSGDLSIFDDYPDINAYLTRNANAQPHQQGRTKYRKDVFFMYSVFKIAPVALQRFIYHRGDYRLFLSEGTSPFSEAAFMESYEVLHNLHNMTSVEDSSVNTYFSVINNITHEPQELQLPDYEPLEEVDNTGLETRERTDDEGNVLHIKSETGKQYHVNMCAILEIGEWLKYLKENGVYDNTRIIIVSDHGRNYDSLPELQLSKKNNLQDVIPALLVKDFGDGEFSYSDEFMTQADVPTMALEGLIENPVNPFTGKVIDSSAKTAHDQLVTFSSNWDVLEHNGNVFDTSDADWYSVHDDIFDLNNWTLYKAKEE